VQLIVGAITDVLEPVLTIAASLSYKQPFATPFGKQEEAWRAKQRFAASQSDHLAVIDAYKAWTRVRTEPYQARKQVRHCTPAWSLSYTTLPW
jgi:HrpA-like RNA helicase